MRKDRKTEYFWKILDLIRNVPEIFECKSRGLFPDSTSFSDVNLVDGLPSARHLYYGTLRWEEEEGVGRQGEWSGSGGEGGRGRGR